MNKIKTLTNLAGILTLLFALTINTVNAQNMQKLGNMNVHYIALGATFLTPEIASAYNVVRSKYNGLLNISVLDNSVSGHPAKMVSLNGTARNDVGQIKTLAFDEVKEGDAIYYLAQVNYSHEETIYFTIKINDGNEQQTLTFKQKFYVD